MKILLKYLPALACIFFLTGCGGQADSIREAEPGLADWKTNGFALSGKLEEEQALWADEYVAWQHEEPPYGSLSEGVRHTVAELGAFGEKIYRFHTYSGTQSEQRKQYLEIYDVTGKTAEIEELTPELTGAQGELANAEITDIYVCADGQLAIQLTGLTLDENQRIVFSVNCILFTDLQGKASGTVDVLPLYREKKIIHEGASIAYGECFCDRAGNIYARGGDSYNPYRVLYISDGTGQLLAEKEYPETAEIGEPLQTREGELIFPIYDNKTRSTRLVWFDSEDGEEKILAELEQEYIKQLYGIQGNELYYEGANGIVRWNIATGERRLAYRFDENGIKNVFDTMLILRESKAPVLRMYGNVNGEEEDWLTVLSSEEMETAEAVRIVGLEEKSVQKIQNCAAVASRRNPNFSYRYENSGAEEQEDFRTRIMAEMMAGGGPDILYVSPEDMELLYNMGLLADLRTLLPEETLEQVLPGVVGLGSVDGTLAGLAPEVSVGTLITLKEIWQEDTWRLEDILGLMETGDFTGIICQGSGGYAPRALLKWLTAYSFENSFLIDWETGKCHFEDERFLKILEYAKKYAEAEPDRSVYGLGIGGCVADTLAGSSLEQFNNNYEKFGDDYYFVGLPTEGESGNYLFCNGVAVVNRNLSNPEAVVNYLECLIGKEVQYMEYANAQLPVRRIFEEDIRYSYDGTESYWNGELLVVKEDGGRILQDFNSFLESCVPGPRLYENLEAIIWEEAQGYFEGDKTAEEAARIINNRIQLYLDERQ